MPVTLTNELRKEYQSLFDSVFVVPARSSEVDRVVSAVVANKTRYEEVGKALGCPWFFVAAIHNLESSLNFSKHLHNGDRLTARTVHVPAGRPRDGNPPFTWEQSARDALHLQGIDNWHDWSIGGLLYKLEQYNGWGYRLHHPEVLSPYLWGFSNHYSSGKYISDGSYSPNAVSQQCGSATLIRRLLDLGYISK